VNRRDDGGWGIWIVCDGVEHMCHLGSGNGVQTCQKKKTKQKKVRVKRYVKMSKNGPEVGSSRIKTSGLATNSSPILNLLISPPLIPLLPPPLPCPILEFATSAMPSFCITSFTRACFSTSGMLSGRRKRAANSSASDTVSVGGSTSCCGTKPTRGILEFEDDCQGKSTIPVTMPDFDFPARISTRVVFPEPFSDPKVR